MWRPGDKTVPGVSESEKGQGGRGWVSEGGLWGEEPRDPCGFPRGRENQQWARRVVTSRAQE